MQSPQSLPVASWFCLRWFVFSLWLHPYGFFQVPEANPRLGAGKVEAAVAFGHSSVPRPGAPAAAA